MKRKYYRKCGDCGCRHEQSEMVRTRFSDNGWLCKKCWARLEDTDVAAFHPEWCAEEWQEQTMIRSEQDHTCEFCYYELFDDRAYPCSRCVCNQPTENLWRPKPQIFGKHADVMIVDECETCRHKHDGMGYCKACSESNYEPKDEPQTEREGE